jgi:hypothetical protein
VIPLLAILACQRWLVVIETPKRGKWSLASEKPIGEERRLGMGPEKSLF